MRRAFRSLARLSARSIRLPVVACLFLSTAVVAQADGDARPGALAPMATLPDINVAWPELSEEVRFADRRVRELLAVNRLPELSPEKIAAFRAAFGGGPAEPDANGAAEETELAGRLSYDYTIAGLDEIPVDDVGPRFAQLSELEKRNSKKANLAQINRRAIEDRQLLADLLKIDGYYDAFVQYLVDPENRKRVIVRFDARPGARYRLSAIDLPLLRDAEPEDIAAFRKALDLEVGDPADQDRIEEGRVAMAVTAGQTGYAFAEVDTPELLVDHERQSAGLTVDGDLGGRYDFGDILIEGDDIFGARHVGRIARFESGERYDARDVEDLKQALIATGLVSRAEATPVRDPDQPGKVDINVAMTAAPPRTVAGQLGYDTGQGFRVEGSWQHRNLFPPEGALTVRGIAGTREQLAAVTFRRNNWLGRDRVLTLGALASNTSYDAYDAKTAQLAAAFERRTTLIFQKEWTWSIGLEAIYSDERGVLDNLSVNRRTYYIGALPLALAYDGTDDLLDPREGFKLAGRLSPEMEFNQGTTSYLRAQIDASTYLPATDALVIAGRTRLGSIFGGGSGIAEIAPSRRNYAGGGGSVRGYGYRTIGPQYVSGDPIGGRGLFEASLEARYRIGNFGFVPFIDAGTVSSELYPDFDDVRVGVGIGGRYYSDFGPIRIDIATPLNRLENDSWIAVYVSLGQAF